MSGPEYAVERIRERAIHLCGQRLAKWRVIPGFMPAHSGVYFSEDDVRLVDMEAAVRDVLTESADRPSDVPPTTDILADAWEFVRRCAAEDYRGPMPEHVRRAQALLADGQVR